MNNVHVTERRARDRRRKRERERGGWIDRVRKNNIEIDREIKEESE